MANFESTHRLLISKAKTALGDSTTYAGRSKFTRNLEMAKFLARHFPQNLELARAALFYGTPKTTTGRYAEILRSANALSKTRGNWSKIAALPSNLRSISGVVMQLAAVYSGLNAVKNGEIAADKHKRIIAQAALETHRRIAQRLGFQSIKEKLQDDAFAILESKAYFKVADALRTAGEAQSDRVQEATTLLSLPINEGRRQRFPRVLPVLKQPYAVWKRIKNADKYPHLASIDSIEGKIRALPDLFHYKVVINGGHSDVYIYYGKLKKAAAVSGWQLLDAPKNFIAAPKLNGYRAFHVKLQKNGSVIEVHVQTRKMKARAEKEVIDHSTFNSIGKKVEELFEDPNAEKREGAGIKYNFEQNGSTTNHSASHRPTLAEAIAYANIDNAADISSLHHAQVLSNGAFSASIYRNGNVILNPPLATKIEHGDTVKFEPAAQRRYSFNRVLKALEDETLRRDLLKFSPETIIGKVETPSTDEETLRPIAKSIVEMAKEYLKKDNAYLLHVPRGATPIFEGVLCAIKQLNIQQGKTTRPRTIKVQFTREDIEFQREVEKRKGVEEAKSIMEKALQHVPVNATLFYPDEIISGTNITANTLDLLKIAKNKKFKIIVLGLASYNENAVPHSLVKNLKHKDKDMQVTARIYAVPKVIWSDVFSLLGSSWGLKHSFPSVKGIETKDRRVLEPKYRKIYEQMIYRPTGKVFKEITPDNRKYNARTEFAHRALFQTFQELSLAEKYGVELKDGKVHVKGREVTFPEIKGILLGQHRAHLLQESEITSEQRSALNDLEVDNYTLIRPREREEHERMMKRLKRLIREEIQTQAASSN